MNKVLIICGSTATGKTELGIKLAQTFGGEIVSADSRQVYRGMDVGTGKDLPANSKFKSQNSKLKLKSKDFKVGYYLFKGIPVWLLDIVEPDYRFNVADYKKCADLVMKDIRQRGKLPIVVGGTGLYIKALVDGIGTIEVEPDWELRKRLGAKDIRILEEELKRQDIKRWEQMNDSDRRNPRRLIRAIEIALDIKNQRSKVKTKRPLPRNSFGMQNSKVNNLFIGLMAPNDILYQRINQRVDERVREGIEEEIRRLLANGYGWDNSALGTTLAYREWQEYFEGKKTKEDTIQKWKFDEHSYSRRQMTWFKKDKKVNWYDISRENYVREVEKLVENWYIGGDA